MTGLFYNEYPPATSCLRSMTFGRLAGAEIAQNLGKGQSQVNAGSVKSEVEIRSKNEPTDMMGDKHLTPELKGAA